VSNGGGESRYGDVNDTAAFRLRVRSRSVHGKRTVKQLGTVFVNNFLAGIDSI
jgi:hypothetical protein